jgi:ADP-ribose pyrophosphatase YjhB (NUDIX family)
MGRKPTRRTGRRQRTPAHVTVAVVLQVRDSACHVLLWQRAQPPFHGRWQLPGGDLGPDETLEASIRRQLAAKVEVHDVAHLEQLETLSNPSRVPGERQLATAYLGLVRQDVDPRLPSDTAWHPLERLPPLAFDHASIAVVGRERLRAKLSYTNIGFALAPEEFTLSDLREIYSAALGYDVSATNLQRVLVRRAVIEPTGGRRPSGPTGGRPGALFRFASQQLEITDQFAVLRPPGPPRAAEA